MRGNADVVMNNAFRSLPMEQVVILKPQISFDAAVDSEGEGEAVGASLDAGARALTELGYKVTCVASGPAGDEDAPIAFSFPRDALAVPMLRVLRMARDEGDARDWNSAFRFARRLASFIDRDAGLAPDNPAWIEAHDTGGALAALFMQRRRNLQRGANDFMRSIAAVAGDPAAAAEATSLPPHSWMRPSVAELGTHLLSGWERFFYDVAPEERVNPALVARHLAEQASAALGMGIDHFFKLVLSQNPVGADRQTMCDARDVILSGKGGEPFSVHREKLRRVVWQIHPFDVRLRGSADEDSRQTSAEAWRTAQKLLLRGGFGAMQDESERAMKWTLQERGLLHYLTPRPLIVAPEGLVDFQAIESRSRLPFEPRVTADITFNPLDDPARYVREVKRLLAGGAGAAKKG